jgi:predicted RNase H-like HicB family nuclease
MRYYHAVVHKDADSAFGVHFPDLPGCFSAAELREVAATDLAEGAFLIMVPWIGRNSKSARVNISLDKAMLAAIDQAAAMRHLTRSAFLAEAARNEIEGRR